MQDLKSRFAQWYNKENNRFGALWAERFRNVLVEDGEALAVLAASTRLQRLCASTAGRSI